MAMATAMKTAIQSSGSRSGLAWAIGAISEARPVAITAPYGSAARILTDAGGPGNASHGLLDAFADEPHVGWP